MFEGRTKEQEEILRRARRPYLARNIATGAGILGFATAVYLYSMFAIKQEDFSDVAAPPPPASSTDASPAK
ncbi:hypothetical protein H4R35_000177 [Dimargaris xerosporica]|nr:hypothetical protein H4R35_000177 [Dimargaris xerosporica]